MTGLRVRRYSGVEAVSQQGLQEGHGKCGKLARPWPGAAKIIWSAADGVCTLAHIWHGGGFALAADAL